MCNLMNSKFALFKTYVNFRFFILKNNLIPLDSLAHERYKVYKLSNKWLSYQMIVIDAQITFILVIKT